MKKNEMYDKLYNYIIAHQEESGTFPSVREMGEAMGLSSTCTVVYYLKKLEEMGKIKRDGRKNRTMQILNKPKNSNLLKTTREDFIDIPLIGTVTAGVPILAVENQETMYSMPRAMFHGEKLFMLSVKGESMINAGILDGDRVIVRQQNTANNGEIVVALIDDSATVKRFYKEADRFRLQPENDSMSPIFTEELTILGKVVGLVRNTIK